MLTTSLSAADPYLSLSLEINYSALGFATMMKPSEDNKAIFPDGYDEIREEAIEILLEDARWIFSGMLYGFDFRYIPGNADQGFDELFKLEPIHQIERGDPALEVYQVDDDYENMRILFYFWPDEHQYRRMGISRGGGFQAAAAAGGIPMMLEGARILSMEEAVKQALRSDLRSLIYNRPLEVGGVVYLFSSPRISIWAGEYRSSLGILYKRDELKTFPLNY
ncbi:MULTISPECIES: hypothetical protein [unclassified Oceanispirochaeta]|uniref:hypothetical protein n=1 Tax=unclassified Oceanispirochaeta TaxID=2635722 RepID=UPI000E08DF98|nr:MULTISPECIES: hypothetical protein [unclassified Oceanispirochaeta]MBF9015361.1 hypothetical protein [Oceanispirochaeta sp. M2]NPD71819.1 hypothetical protein [Oceanispirochaeta sp. M1]RDG33008.1 hypothetical protein DV872_06880 [Oceanispirochaeta sp. M1]